jgi:excisionase family DNA binding protein
MDRSGAHAPTQSALVTKIEAARLLGVSRYTIRRLVQLGRLEEIRLADGMTPRLRRDEVLALAESDSS